MYSNKAMHNAPVADAQALQLLLDKRGDDLDDEDDEDDDEDDEDSEYMHLGRTGSGGGVKGAAAAAAARHTSTPSRVDFKARETNLLRKAAKTPAG